MKMLSNPAGRRVAALPEKDLRMSLWAQGIEPDLTLNLMNFEIQKGQNNHKHRKKLILKKK